MHCTPLFARQALLPSTLSPAQTLNCKTYTLNQGRQPIPRNAPALQWPTATAGGGQVGVGGGLVGYAAGVGGGAGGASSSTSLGSSGGGGRVDVRGPFHVQGALALHSDTGGGRGGRANSGTSLMPEGAERQPSNTPVLSPSPALQQMRGQGEAATPISVQLARNRIERFNAPDVAPAGGTGYGRPDASPAGGTGYGRPGEQVTGLSPQTAQPAPVVSPPL